MPYSNVFAATAALLVASLVIAAPATDTREAPRLEGRSTFTVSQVENKAFNGHKGFAARAKAYLKYGVPLPHDLVEAISKSGTFGNVTAIPQEDDSEYLVPVQIGTPGQTLNLDFDTGSADLWVFSSQTPKADVDGQLLYKIKSSKTAKLKSGFKWSITYGDGSSSSGDVYTDVVSVGGVSFASQAVESAEKVSSQFTNDTASSGLLGLSFSKINTVRPTSQLTFFDNVKSSLASPVFTADLKKGVPGSYDFGIIDSSKYTGNISYVPVTTSNGFWEFTGSGYAVGSGAFKSESIDAIADTGTTLLLVPDDVVSAYYAQVPGAAFNSSQGGYIFDCSSKLPSFTFGAGTYRGVIPGTFINYGPATGSQCFGGIQSNSGIGFSIYGDILLKAQFVVFDEGKTRLGFAAKPL